MNSKGALPQLLLVDHDKIFQEYVSKGMRSAGYDVVSSPNWNCAKTLIKNRSIQPEVIFLELFAAGNRCTEDLREICSEAGKIPIVAISSSPDRKNIVRAIRGGAWDYICKPVELNELCQALREIAPKSETDRRPKTETVHADTAQVTVQAKAPPELPPEEILIHNRKMKQIYDTILRIAPTKVPVLIEGETGVGKGIFAQMIYEHSSRANQPYVKLNCAAMPADLVESELFGYRKGAFTGAYEGRSGKFEYVHKGTIFLDEIGEFTPSIQAKLLQVLQDGKFTRLGGNQEIQADVRVIAATNRNIERAIELGNFREDLFYRLNVVNIKVPPLRQRKDEIEIFCEYFLKRFSLQYNCPPTIPARLTDLFMSYQWPGNIRELENTLRLYAVLQNQDSLQADLEERIARQTPTDVDTMVEDYLETTSDQHLDLKEIRKRAASLAERGLIVKTLNETRWNKWRAAKQLKISYKTLLNKIGQYQIET